MACGLSIPPWGWWPLAFVGLWLLARSVAGVPMRTRWWRGVAFGIGMFVPGLWWMGDFHALGAILVVLLETSFVAAAGAQGVNVATGKFRAMMQVELVNEGPVTLLLDSRKGA